MIPYIAKLNTYPNLILELAECVFRLLSTIQTRLAMSDFGINKTHEFDSPDNPVRFQQSFLTEGPALSSSQNSAHHIMQAFCNWVHAAPKY